MKTVRLSGVSAFEQRDRNSLWADKCGVGGVQDKVVFRSEGGTEREARRWAEGRGPESSGSQLTSKR